MANYTPSTTVIRTPDRDALASPINSGYPAASIAETLIANRDAVLRALGAEEVRSTFRDFDGSMKTRRYYVTLKEDVTDAES